MADNSCAPTVKSIGINDASVHLVCFMVFVTAKRSSAPTGGGDTMAAEAAPDAPPPVLAADVEEKDMVLPNTNKASVEESVTTFLEVDDDERIIALQVPPLLPNLDTKEDMVAKFCLGDEETTSECVRRARTKRVRCFTCFHFF